MEAIMKIIEIRARAPELMKRLLKIWESSVRATHRFLSDGEIQKIKEYVPQALEGIAHLLIAENETGQPAAFMGIENGTLEMLFISPEERGKGLGKRLIHYGIENYGVQRLAVNEQNPQAKGFYEHMGFQVYKRMDCDEQGNPYPLLYMSLVRKPRENLDHRGNRTNTPTLETERLILRKFAKRDMEALFLILRDEEVNRFLPWYPVKDLDETSKFYEENYASKYARQQAYAYAVCLKEDDVPIGYINVAIEEPHDFGYGLRKEFWHKGIVTEAGQAVIRQVKKDGLPYITATHDRNNPRSGGVMRNVGMKYQYSYEEQWQPKNILVTFRMYQLNLDGKESRVYQKYWDDSAVHFIEPNL